MVDSFEKQCEEFSFFRLPDIKLRVKRQLKEKQPLLAKQYLIRLREFMSSNYDKIYPLRSFMFWHLHNHPDFDDEIQRLIEEIDNENIEQSFTLENKTQANQTEDNQPINIRVKGIVLYFLMYYGSDEAKAEFKAKCKPEALGGYLLKLGLEGSGNTVYTKSIVHLVTDADRNDGVIYGKERKYGQFTREEFKNAIQFLKSKDQKAYERAESEFAYLVVADEEGGNYPKFFKK